MKLKLDPSSYSQKLLPEDDFDAVCVKLFKTSSKAGNRSGGFQFEIKSNSGEETTLGRKVIGNVTVTQDSLWKANQLYKAVTGEDMPEQEFDDEDQFLDWLYGEVNGQSVRLRVKHKIRPDTGETALDITYLSS